jgi:hypothetical protein
MPPPPPLSKGFLYSSLFTFLSLFSLNLILLFSHFEYWTSFVVAGSGKKRTAPLDEKSSDSKRPKIETEVKLVDYEAADDDSDNINSTSKSSHHHTTPKRPFWAAPPLDPVSPPPLAVYSKQQTTDDFGKNLASLSSSFLSIHTLLQDHSYEKIDFMIRQKIENKRARDRERRTRVFDLFFDSFYIRSHQKVVLFLISWEH